MTERTSRPTGLLRRSAAVVVAASLVFCMIGGVLLVANSLLEAQVRPVDHAALQALQEAASRNPKDEELKTAFRELDRTVRTEHERCLAFRQRGVLVLAGGLVVLLASSLVWASTSPAQLALPGTAAVDEANERASRRVGVLAGIVALVVFSVALLWPKGGGGPRPADSEGSTTDAPPRSYADARGQWPAFRGIGAAGVADDTVAPPLVWDGTAGKNVVWKVRPPRPGFSSPILWDGTLFATGADKEKRELYAYDAKTAALLWTADTDGIVGSPAELPSVSPDTGYAASSPTTDGVRVYAIYATGDVIAVDFSGQRVWARNLGPPENPYGHASSLVVHRGRLLVQYDHFGSAQLIALDAATGETVWEVKRQVAASWATPVLATVAEHTEVYLNAEPFVMAFNAETGEKLWQNECMGGEVGPSPAYADGLAYFTTDYAMLAAIHTGGTDKDGTIAWQVDEELPDVSSPVAGNGLLFVSTSAGIISCYDAKTGDLQWREEYDKGFYASPVIAAGRVYVTDLNGTTFVFAAEREYKLLASNPLGEGAMGSFAFQGNRAYVRGNTHLYCLSEVP
jgi:outer membrane protein assembly factor BamB